MSTMWWLVIAVLALLIIIIAGYYYQKCSLNQYLPEMLQRTCPKPQ